MLGSMICTASKNSMSILVGTQGILEDHCLAGHSEHKFGKTEHCRFEEHKRKGLLKAEVPNCIEHKQLYLIYFSKRYNFDFEEHQGMQQKLNF